MKLEIIRINIIAVVNRKIKVSSIPNIRLFSYKLTNDSGFAPNPFGRVMTLATCKPKIRQSKIPGDWIAGFTSGHLNGDYIQKIHSKTVILIPQRKARNSLLTVMKG